MSKRRKEEVTPPTFDEVLNQLAQGNFGNSQVGQLQGKPIPQQTEFDLEETGQIWADQSATEVRDQMAVNQSDTRAILNSLLQIGTTIAGDSIAGVGYLGELKDIGDIVQGTETEWGNWLTNIGDNIKEWGQEVAPVYASQEALEGFKPLDREWWASNIPSIGSTFALMLPAAGAAGITSKLLGRAGNAAKIANRLSTTQKVLPGISAAVTSRHIENMMEGKEVFDNVYNEAIRAGKDDAEAKKIAGNAAAQSYNTNYINLLTDIPQYMAAFGFFGKASGTAKKSIGKDLLEAIGTESLEEATQVVISKEAERTGKLEIEGKEDDGTSFGQRLTQYLQDPQLWTASFFGALGGAVFTAGGKAIEKTVDLMTVSPEQRQMQAQINIVNEAIESNDFERAKATVDQMAQTNPEDLGMSSEQFSKATQQFKDLITHAEQEFMAIPDSPLKPSQVKLSTRAKQLEQKKEGIDIQTEGIKAKVKNTQDFDLYMNELKLAALSNNNTAEAKKYKKQLEDSLKDKEGNKIEFDKSQFAAYTAQMRKAAKDSALNEVEALRVNNELVRLNDPEEQAKIVKEQQKAEEQARIDQYNNKLAQAEQVSTPQELEAIDIEAEDKGRIASDKIAQEKQSAPAPSTFNDRSDIANYLAERYEGRPFLEKAETTDKNRTREDLVDIYSKRFLNEKETQTQNQAEVQADQSQEAQGETVAQEAPDGARSFYTKKSGVEQPVVKEQGVWKRVLKNDRVGLVVQAKDQIEEANFNYQESLTENEFVKSGAESPVQSEQTFSDIEQAKNIEQQKADIERRREEAFKQITSPEDFEELGLEQNKDELPYSTTINAGDENLEETLFANSKEKLIEKINAKYDAEYVDKVKKGEFTTQQAKDALKEINRLTSELEKQINNAELAALEQSVDPVDTTDIDEAIIDAQELAVDQPQEIVSYEPGDYDETQSASSEEDQIDQVSSDQGMFNHFVLSKYVEGKGYKFSGWGAAHKFTSEIPDGWKVRKSSSWTPVKDESGNPVRSEWTHKYIDPDVAANIGRDYPDWNKRNVFLEVAKDDLYKDQVDMFKIYLAIENEDGQVIRFAVMPSTSTVMDEDRAIIEAIREQVYAGFKQDTSDNNWYRFPQSTKLTQISKGKFWNTGTFNNPLDVNPEGILAIGTTAAESTVLVTNGVEAELNIKPKAGAVYQQITTSSGETSWYRLFTKKLSDSSLIADEGEFQVWEELVGYTEQTSYIEVLKQLMSLVDQPDVWKANWTAIRDEMQSIVRFSVDGKYMPDFRENLQEVLKGRSGRQYMDYLIDKYNLKDKPVQIDSRKINQGNYNNLINKRLKSDLNPNIHTHTPVFFINSSMIDKVEVNEPTKEEFNPGQITESDITDDYAGFSQSIESIPDLDKAVAYLSRVLPNIPVTTLDQIVRIGNQEAFGFFSRAGIELYRNAGKGTAKHEAGHIVFSFGLNEKQQQRLLTEAESRYKLTQEDLDRAEMVINKLQTNQSIQEYALIEKIMEEFESYAVTGDTSFSSRAKRLFKRLLEMIRVALNHSPTIDSFFYRIDAGLYKNVNLDSVSQDYRAYSLNSFRSIQEKKVRTNTTISLFDQIIANIINRDGLTTDEAYAKAVGMVDQLFTGDLSNYGGSIQQRVNKHLEKLQSKYTLPEHVRAKFDRYLTAIQSKDYQAYVLRQLNTRGIKTKYEQAEIAGEDTAQENWQNSTFDYSPLASMSSTLKRVLSNIPIVTNTSSEGVSTFLTDDLGFRRFHDGNRIYADLQTRIGNAVNPEHMQELLNNLEEPHYQFLNRHLTDQHKTELWYYLAQKDKPDYLDVVNRPTYKNDQRIDKYELLTSSTDNKENDLLNETFDFFINSKYYKNGTLVKDVPLTDKYKINKEVFGFTEKYIREVPESLFINAAKVINEGDLTFSHKPIKDLVKKVAKNYPNTYQDSHLNVEGERMYQWINSSFLGKIIKAMRAGLFNWAKYEKDPMYSHLIATGVIDKAAWEKTSWSVIGGIKHTNKGRGTTYSSYSDTESAIALLTMYDNDIYNVSVLSDAPVMAGIKLPKHNSIVAINKLYELRHAEYIRNSKLVEKYKSKFGKYDKAFEFFDTAAPDKAQINADIDARTNKLINKLNKLGLIKDDKFTFNQKSATYSDIRAIVANYQLNQSLITLMAQGDPAFYKGAADFFKRAKEVWSPGQYLDTTAYYVTPQGQKITFPVDKKYKVGILKDIEEPSAQIEEIRKVAGDEIADKYKKVNLADAQGIIDIYTYRLREIGENRWNHVKQFAYQLITKGISNKKADLQAELDSYLMGVEDVDRAKIESEIKAVVFQPIKPFYFAHHLMDNVLVHPMQNKDSEYLLTPRQADGNPELEKVLTKFGYTKTETGWQLDEAGRARGEYTDKFVFESGIKVPMGDQIGDLDSYTPVEFDWTEYRRQMETPEHYRDVDNRFGSQIMKLIVSDLPQELLPLREEFNNLIKEDLDRSLSQLNMRFQDDAGNLDKTKIINMLKEEVVDRGLGDQYLEALEEIGEDTKLPLYHPLHSYRIQAIVNSLYKNNITKQKFLQGVALYNVTSYGLKKKPKIVFENGRIKHIEALVPAYSSRFDKYRNDDGSIDIEKVPEEMLEGIVYRIPTEDKYSMFNIKIVGFTDDIAGGGIILPPEVTTIAGLDYDIDKVYGFFKANTPEENSINIVKNSFKGREFLRENREELNNLYNEKREILSQIDGIIEGRTVVNNRRDSLAHLYEEIDIELAFLRNDRNSLVKELQEEIASQQELNNFLSNDPDVSQISSMFGSTKDQISNQIDALNSYIEDLENKQQRIASIQINVSSDIINKQAEINSIFNRNKVINSEIETKKAELEIKADEFVKKNPELKTNFDRLLEKAKSDNRKLDIMREILSHQSTVENFLNPGGFQQIEAVVKYIKGVKEQAIIEDLSINDMADTIAVINRMNTGKALVGIAANFNSSRALWQGYDLKMTKGFLFNDEEYNDLSSSVIDSIRPGRSLAEVLAAAVDNGKDPLAEFFNLNTYTADMAMSMLAAGIPIRTVALFLSQPRIKQFTRDYFNAGEIEPDYAPDIDGFVPDSLNDKELEQGLKDIDLATGEVKNEERQARMLEHFMYYMRLAKPVGSFVQATKIPDSGTGPSIAANLSKISQYNDAIKKIKKTIENADVYLKANNHMRAFYDNSFLEATKTFKELGFPDFDNQLFREIVKDLEQIKQEPLSPKEFERLTTHYMDYLSMGYPAFQERLKTIEQDALTGLRLLKEHYKGKTHSFVDRLNIQDDIIRFKGVMGMDDTETEFIRQLWQEMLTDTSPISGTMTVQQAAENLVYYSFFRSGFRTAGKESFSTLIPVNWFANLRYNDLSFNDYIKKQIKSSNNNNTAHLAFVEQYIRNNFKALPYIPEIKVKKQGDKFITMEQTSSKYIKFEDQLYIHEKGFAQPLPELGLTKPRTKKLPIKLFYEYYTGVPNPTSVFNNKQITVEALPKVEEQPSVQAEVNNPGRQFSLNTEQAKAYKQMQDYLKSNKSGWFMLEGKAGTGKTFTMSEFVKYAVSQGNRVLFGALSHKATNVLNDKINEAFGGQKPPTVVSATVAKMVGADVDQETGKFEINPYTRSIIEDYDVVIVDETSMINEEALAIINKNMSKGAKLYFLGDSGQLPPIREANDQFEGQDSPTFDTSNKAKLLTRVRQGEQSPILPYADYYWNNSQSDNPVKDPVPQDQRQTKETTEGNLIFAPKSKAMKMALKEFKKAVANKDPNVVKIVAYRNNTRKAINKYVRDSIFNTNEEFVPGDIVMFFSPYEISQELTLQNSDEFSVQSVRKAKINRLGTEYNGYMLTFDLTDANGIKVQEEIPVIASSDKQKFQNKLQELFREASKFPKRTQERRKAYNKAWSFKNSVADIDYSYAITSHKSQGSTYNSVIVYESDIMGVAPISNKAKSQSMYTAITRAKNNAIIIDNNAEAQDVELKTDTEVQEVTEQPTGQSWDTMETVQEEFTQGVEEIIDSAWLNYGPRINAKRVAAGHSLTTPDKFAESAKKMIEQKGVDYFNELMKKCYS